MSHNKENINDDTEIVPNDFMFLGPRILKFVGKGKLLELMEFIELHEDNVDLYSAIKHYETREGMNALTIAEQNGDVDTIFYLLQHGYTLSEIEDDKLRKIVEFNQDYLKYKMVRNRNRMNYLIRKRDKDKMKPRKRIIEYLKEIRINNTRK